MLRGKHDDSFMCKNRNTLINTNPSKNINNRHNYRASPKL